MVGDTNEVHNGATLWLLDFFIERPAATALNTHMTLKTKSHKRQKEGTVTVTSYCENVTYLLDTCQRMIESQKLMPVWCDSRIHRTNRSWIMMEYCTAKNFNNARIWWVCSQAIFSSDCRNQSGTICTHIGDRRRTLQDMIWRVIWFR